MDNQTLKEQRAKTLNSLRINANQDGAWKSQVVGFLDEINRDNLNLRAGYSKLLREVESLKQERVAV